MLHPAPDAFGRLAERVARLIGTARFLAGQSLIIAIWLGVNAGHTPLRFDKYPFSFLTLILSLQAAYAAPLILLAQNRQEDRDRVVAAEDRDAGKQLRADTDYISVELASLRNSQGHFVTRDYLDAALARQLQQLLDRLPSASTTPATEQIDRSRVPDATPSRAWPPAQYWCR